MLELLGKIITKHQQTQFDRTKMTEDMKKLVEENSKLKEGLLDVQCRSMKNNLIFTGLSEQGGENCEGLLRDISELNVFVNVHFIVQEISQQPFTIFAPLFRQTSKNQVVERFLARLLKGTHFGVREQFQPEIEDRRRLLCPIMREEKIKSCTSA
jgi:hypothetical protein